MKNIKKIIYVILIFLNEFKIFKRLFIQIRKLNNTVQIEYEDCSFLFINENYYTDFRYQTYFTKEPDTINWIKKFKDIDVYWDIGANIGLYSIFAAKYSQSKVFAFEPSYYNLNLLNRNIGINKLNKQITILPLPLDKENKLGFFKIGNEETGTALSNFCSLSEMTKSGYQTFSMNPDSLIELYKIPKPDHIKIDVDGNELSILFSLNNFLNSAKSVLVEINNNNISEKEIISNYLVSKNFYLSDLGICPNQIWLKK